MIKPDPPASLADTREAAERLDARGEHVTPVDKAAGRGHRPRARRLGCRVADGRADQLVRQPGARGADRRDRRTALPGLPGHALGPRAAGVPRVRARADGVHELLCAAEGPNYVEHLQCALEAVGAKAEVNILRSDAGLMTTREAARNPIYASSPGPPAASPAPSSSRARQASTTSSPSTWAAPRPTSRCVRTESRDRPRNVDRPLPDQGAVGERAHGRRRRWLDRARARADEGAPRRPAVGRRGAGPGRVRQGRRGADRDRRERRARPSAAALLGGEMPLDVDAAREAVQTIADALGLARSRRRPRASSRSSTRTWPARCGSSRSSVVMTRATSRSSPTAARGRCTRTRWRRSSAPSRCSSRLRPGSCTRSATSSPISATSSRAPISVPSEEAAGMADILD